MRVAVIAPPWVPVPPPSYGGTEFVVDTLCRFLAGDGHDVTLVAHPDSTCPVPTRSVVPAVDTTRMGRANIELEHAIGAYDIAAGLAVDAVSDHTVGGPVCAALYPSLAAVATNHNAFTRTTNAIYTAAAPYADVVAISRSHAATATAPIAAVIHHGIDVETFPLGTGRGGYLAMLTRMAPDKGVHRAVAIARRAGVGLRIAAKMRDAHERDYFERMVRPHLGGEIEYVGELDARDKRTLLADAVALLNPIEWEEPFGLAMIESLACGTPVVATPRGAAPEIVDDGETGVLRATDDDLVAAIGRIDRIDRTLCRRRVGERFSVDAMGSAYVAAFLARRQSVDRAARR